MAEAGFPDSVISRGLCNALEEVDDQEWTLIGEGRWANSCQQSRGSHRIIISENLGRADALFAFSCALSGGRIDAHSNASKFFHA